MREDRVRHKLFFLLTSIFCLSTALAAESSTIKPARIYDQGKRSQILGKTTELQDEATQQRVGKRAKARVSQEMGGKIVQATDEFDELFFRYAPLSIKQHPASTFVSIISSVVGVVGVGLRAHGRRKEALENLISANEQILEAASKSFEKIAALSKTLTDLIGPKTIKEAHQENQASELDMGKKILNLFSPSNFINTFNNFTDDLYITDNKADRWEKIKHVLNDLKKEEATFDDYIALLQIKLLERELMELHKFKNWVTTKEGKTGYIGKIQESSNTIHRAIEITNEKIKPLKEKIEQLKLEPPKKGVLSRIKKITSKDSDARDANILEKENNIALFKNMLDATTLDTKTLESILENLEAERNKYINQEKQIDLEKTKYTEIKLDTKEIETRQKDIVKQIAAIKGRKAEKASLEDLAGEMGLMKNQIEDLQKRVPK